MGALVDLIAVVLLNAYAAVLIVLRSRVYGAALYRPMLVNVALSFVPVVGALVAVAGLLFLAPVLSALAGQLRGGVPFILWAYLVVATLLWLLFFPNAIYLITELNFSHRAANDEVPLWFDIIHTLTLTLSGIANAIASLLIVQAEFIVLIADPSGGAGAPAFSWFFAGAVIVLGAFGVYLGRYLRVNSWDVKHPASLARKLVNHLREPGRALEVGGLVLSHAVLVALVYVPVFTLFYRASFA
ncbi:hypothetical protein GCM10022288_08670 [Gryllotalpicola kribbensis]|uniref:DUF1361 domain-containing protein n=1 Tax=Gryllotalpicola kribbensis TaxID=993084 RepID=A0ABP8ALM8_9MICO